MTNKRKMQMGAVVAALALVTMACTCGGFTSGLSQAQGQLKTAEALATSVATSGVVGTVQAYATQGAAGTATPSGDVVIGATTAVGGNVTVGGAPDNIPVMEGAQNLVSASGSVVYSVSADLKTTEDFYKKGMTDKGWTEAEAPVELGGQVATLTYTNDTQKAVVALTAAGGTTQVAIAVTAK